MNLLFISLAPVVIIGVYIWVRDKYEKEPVGLLARAVILGALITIPVIVVEHWLSRVGNRLAFGTVWDAFVVAGTVEEGFKFLVFYLIIWRNVAFNEKFDGIVYAVFISMGFAGVENILYVAEGGIQVALIRAITAVPAHALFGVVMGYYLGLARFSVGNRNRLVLMAFIWPVLAHGFYDFCLMSGHSFLLAIFIPYLLWLWITGQQRMKELSDLSLFKKD